MQAALEASARSREGVRVAEMIDVGKQQPFNLLRFTAVALIQHTNRQTLKLAVQKKEKVINTVDYLVKGKRMSNLRGIFKHQLAIFSKVSSVHGLTNRKSRVGTSLAGEARLVTETNTNCGRRHTDCLNSYLAARKHTPNASGHQCIGNAVAGSFPEDFSHLNVVDGKRPNLALPVNACVQAGVSSTFANAISEFDSTMR